MVKVSIIVPMYNASKYINECISSIQGQSLEDIEIICVNDGSTDDSMEKVLALAEHDHRIKVIDKENSGYGHTVNEGIKGAEGKYIGIVESDDFIASDMYASLYSIAQEHDIDVVMSDYYAFKTGDTESKIYIKEYKNCPYNTVINPLEEQAVFLGTGIWTGLYKRQFLYEKEIWLNETPGASYQDTSFLFKVWASTQRCYIYDGAFVHYRTDNDNSSVHSNEKIFCVCDEFIEIEGFLDTKKRKQLLPILLAKKFKVYKWNYSRLIAIYQYVFLIKMQEELMKIYLETKQLYENPFSFMNTQEENEYMDIIHNMKTYFNQTSKEYRNDKLYLASDLSPKLNIMAYKNGFINLLNDFDQIIIYGAGEISKKLKGFLIENNIYDKVIGYAVSRQEKNQSEIDHKQIKEINDYSDLKASVLVLIAVSDRYQMEINSNLKNKHFANIFSVNSEVLKAIKIR